MLLFTNSFSPFARKIEMALAYKGLEFESIDGLAKSNRTRLLSVNPRVEVPVLVDGEVTVVNSSDIAAYLDLKYPEKPIYPQNAKARVAARSLERLADTRVDAIIVACSLWVWADRHDQPPAGLMEAGQRDLDFIFTRIETILAQFSTPLPFGHPTVAEFAFWPHLAALRSLKFTLSAEKYPRLTAWLTAMRRDKIFMADTRRTINYLKSAGTNADLERAKIFWRGDRIEWLLARGFHEWFFNEIKSDRTIWPD